VQFNIIEIELAKVVIGCLMMMMRHILFTELLNLEAKVGQFKGCSRNY
jgi:hypothetical protein